MSFFLRLVGIHPTYRQLYEIESEAHAYTTAEYVELANSYDELSGVLDETISAHNGALIEIALLKQRLAAFERPRDPATGRIVKRSA